MKGNSTCGGDKRRRLEDRVCESTIMELPVFILLEVFFRLPIASVIACTHVCKQWCKILKSPDFTDNFATSSRISSFILKYNQPRMYCPPISHFALVQISGHNGDSFFTSGSMEQLLIPPGRIIKDHRATSFTVVGSCRGLICIKEATLGQVTIFVSNPLTREFVALPRHSAVARHITVEAHNLVEYMFGFSSKANSFKVMRIQHRDLTPKIGSKIFTIGVNARWRKCSDIPMISDVRTIVFLNEFFHWIDNDFADVSSINTFDIGKEKVGRISAPPGVYLSKSFAISLGQLDGQLCLLDSIVPSQVALWKLNEYGVAESWTRDVLLRTCFPSNLNFLRLTPICLSKQGEIILTDYRRLMACDSEQGKGSDLVENPFWRPYSIASLLVYDPSFISVKHKRSSRGAQVGNVS